MIIKDHIALFENMASDAYCKDAINWFESKSTELCHENVGDRDDYTITNPDRYESFVKFDNGLLKKSLQKSYIAYRKNYDLGYMDQSALPTNCSLTDFKIQKSIEGGGFCTWHDENVHGTFPSRFLVWMLYLNDVEHGGKTEFFSGQKVQPKTGRLVLWPPYFTHIHRAAPDLKENKYILTGWFEYKVNGSLAQLDLEQVPSKH